MLNKIFTFLRSLWRSLLLKLSITINIIINKVPTKKNFNTTYEYIYTLIIFLTKVLLTLELISIFIHLLVFPKYRAGVITILKLIFTLNFNPVYEYWRDLPSGVYEILNYISGVMPWYCFFFTFILLFQLFRLFYYIYKKITKKK